MQRLTSFFSFIGRLVNVDISLSFEAESNNAFSISAEVDMELKIHSITENEAAYVWSDMWNEAIDIRDLTFSHVDTDGIPGYRINGTSRMVWRNEISPVALA